MKNMFKKAFFVTALITLMTVVLCFGAGAKTVPASGSCGDNVTYTYNSTTKELVISGTGAMEDYSSDYDSRSPFYYSDIKSVIIKDGVTTIGNSAFYCCESLTSVTIGNSVTTIGDYAFKECYSLKSVTIGNRVTIIGSYAFAYCYSLTSVPIGNSVTTIGDGAFCDCDSLTSVTIGNSVTTIGDEAFWNCSSLTSVTIPDSVTTIVDSAFKECYSLTSITVNKNNKYYCNDSDGVLFDKNKTKLIQYPIGNIRTEYTIPNSVTTIGDYAFYDFESLTSVTIGNSVTTIGDHAFAGCYRLTSVTISDSVTTIGSHAFYSTKWYSNQPDGVVYAGKVAYGYTGTMPANTSITLKAGTKGVADSAFSSCDSLTSVTIPDSVIIIGDSAFYYCDSLTSVTIGNSVTTIGDSAFRDCENLTSVTIPDSVITIGARAFDYCSSLTSVTIGNSVTTIGDYAFRGCDDLTSVTIPDSVTTMGDFVFDECFRLKSVTIGNSVTTIGSYAFSSCERLTSVTIPDSVTTIGDYTFYWCERLTSVTIPDSVTTIGDGAFESCDRLKDVYYYGTQEQWNDITIGYNNSALTGATIHYNYCIHKNIVDVAQQNPTCTKAGYTAGKQCSHCKEWISGHEEIPATDHSYTATVTTSPTCISKGVKTYVCQNDNTHTYTEEIAVDSANHVNKADIPQQDATCESVGYTAGVYCNDCKKWISGHSKISATGHTYKTTTTKATLTKNGSVVTACTACGTNKSTTTIYSPKTFTLSATKYIHDGKNKTPKLTVKDANGKTLVKNTDYKTSVASKRAGIGRYTVKVTFMGNYEGTKNLYFYILPGAPETVKSSSQGTTSNKLTWSEVSGAAGYTLYYYSNSKKTYVKINTTTDTTYTVEGLLTGTKYTFKVVAYGKTSAGKVYDSETYTLLKSATKTKTPELTKVTASSTKGKAYVYHTDVKGETGYTVYYSTSKTSGFKKYANFKADTTRCDITGLTSGKTYYFKVRTYIKTDSGYVYSPWSAVKGVKVK